MSDKLPDPGTARYRMYKLARKMDKEREESCSSGRTPGLPE